jgi:hypothetical protein
VSKSTIRSHLLGTINQVIMPNTCMENTTFVFSKILCHYTKPNVPTRRENAKIAQENPSKIWLIQIYQYSTHSILFSKPNAAGLGRPNTLLLNLLILIDSVCMIFQTLIKSQRIFKTSIITRLYLAIDSIKDLKSSGSANFNKSILLINFFHAILNKLPLIRLPFFDRL